MQLRVRLWLLSYVPLLLSLLLWAGVLYFWSQSMIDGVQRYFLSGGHFHSAGVALSFFGLSALKTFLVPLIALWPLLPLMALTVLTFFLVAAMPAISKHVTMGYFPDLKKSGNINLANALLAVTPVFFLFVLLWIVTSPLCLIPALVYVLQPALWAWLSYRVIGYIALADHADDKEMKNILHAHRWTLFAMGLLPGAAAALPTTLWMGGWVPVPLFPVFAAGAIWFYGLIFIFTGCWFQYYCLDALAKFRAKKSVIPE